MTLASLNFLNLMGRGLGGATPTARPERVEGLSFLPSGAGQGKGFDKLSPNGFPRPSP